MAQRTYGRRLCLVLLILALLAGLGPGSRANDRLAIRLSRAIAWAPAALTVFATVDHNDENRELEIIAESEDFYRASRISLDGAPRQNVFEFRSLPSGKYEVTGVLIDAHGQRVTATRVFQVAPSPGAR